MKVILTYKSQLHTYSLAEHSNTVSRLKDIIHQELDLPPTTQKLLAKGKVLQDDDSVPDGKIMLIASSPESIAAVKLQAQKQAEIAARRAAAPKMKATLKSTVKQGSEYRFHRIASLQHLHEPERAQAFLERLANDSSIKRLMDLHHLTVGLLTEMDPRLHTRHDSKTLGLNKNGGEEILLRLRTDELDGYRDYRGVKSTLIHELVHNRVNDHPREFWDLFRDWSAEVESWERGSRVAHGDVYIPEESDSGAAWSGATKTLGSSRPVLDSSREDRARAAEDRMRQG